MQTKTEQITIIKTGEDFTNEEIDKVKEAGTTVDTLTMTGQKATYETTMATHTDETALYEIYKQMDNDAIVSAALNLYADSATQTAQNGHVATVVSADKNFQAEINEFLWKVVKIDTEAWNYVRTIAQYGKLILDTEANNNGGEWAFTEVDKLETVIPLTYGQNNVKYYAVQKTDDDNEIDDYWKTSLNTEGETSNYTIQPRGRYISGFNGRKYIGEMTVTTTSELYNDKEDIEVLNMRAGRSLLQDVVSTWQALTTLEDALVLNRLTKSTAFNLVTINVGDSTNKEALKMINDVRTTLKSSETLDDKNNKYKNRLSPIPVNDFVIVPTKGDKGAVTIEAVGGDVGTVPMEDIDYLRNKLIGGLGMLKAYIGFEETTPGGLGDTTLTMLDEKLARTTKRLRATLVDVINQQIEHYWTNSSLNRTLAEMPEYEIELGPLSTAESAANRAEETEKINLATAYKGMFDQFEDLVNKEKMFNFLVGEVMGIDISKIDNTPDDKETTVELKQLAEQRPRRIINENRFTSNKVTRINNRRSKPRKINAKGIDLMKQVPSILENTSLYIKVNGKEIPLNVISKSYAKDSVTKVFEEATYKQLKQKTNITDPLRIAKSKKITGTYEGLDTDGNISFIVTAEDPAKNKKAGKPTSYITSVDLKDLFKIIDDRKKGQNDLSLVQNAMQGNIAVACECPASMYWGQQYNGTREGYSIVHNDIAPERNKPTQVICKHVAATLTWLPFWSNTIVKDLRNLEILPNHTQAKLNRKQEEDLIKEISQMTDDEVEVEIEVDDKTDEVVETAVDEIITKNIKQTRKKPGKVEDLEGEEDNE